MNTKTSLALLTLPLAACASTPALQDAGGASWQLGLFAEDTELDEVEFSDPGFAELTLKDQDRTRSGLQASYGTDDVRGLVRVYKEEFLDDSLGVALGIEGQPYLTTLDWGPEGVDVLLDYGFLVGVTSDNGVTVGGSSGDLTYVEGTTRLGLAFDLHTGWVPSVGLIHQSLTGAIEFDGESDHDWGDEDFEGELTSAYLGADYLLPDYGVQLGVRGLVGDANSVGMSVTWSL